MAARAMGLPRTCPRRGHTPHADPALGPQLLADELGGCLAGHDATRGLGVPDCPTASPSFGWEWADAILGRGGLRYAERALGAKAQTALHVWVLLHGPHRAAASVDGDAMAAQSDGPWGARFSLRPRLMVWTVFGEGLAWVE
jgi:hypothetical protein